MEERDVKICVCRTYVLEEITCKK